MLLLGVFLVYISNQVLAVWVVCLVLMTVAVSLTPIKIQPTPQSMGIAGFLSGFFATSSAIGGPPMALIVQHKKTESICANLSFCFAISSLLTFMIQVQAGHLSTHHIDLTLPLIPAAILGYCVAAKTTDNLPKNKIRVGILVLCSIASIIEISHAIAHS